MTLQRAHTDKFVYDTRDKVKWKLPPDFDPDMPEPERVAEHLPGQHSQLKHGGGNGHPEIVAFEQQVAAEEHARNPRPGYGGSFGPERGMIVDADGKVLWSGQGSAARIEDKDISPHLRPGVTMTHFHPDAHERAHLAAQDVNTALQTGATIRAFNANGAWEQYTPHKGGGALGITVQDMYRDAQAYGGEHGVDLQDAMSAVLRSVSASRGEWTEGRHEGIAEADDRFARAERRGSAIITARALEQRLYNLSSEQLAELRWMINDARKDTMEAMSKATREWNYRDRKAVLDSLDTTLARLEARMSPHLASAQQQSWDMGGDVQTSIERAARVSLSTKPNIDPGVLAAALQMTPEMITNVTQDIRRRVGHIVRLGALGQRDPLAMMREMGDLTGKGPWKDAFTRGEVIYRTEMGRTFQLATQARLNAHAATEPGWKKKWVAVHDTRTRPTHERADGQVVDADAPFEVGDSRLMFPHDPAGSAKETINCRCVSIPWRDEWATAGRTLSPDEQRIRDLTDEADAVASASEARTKDWWEEFDRQVKALEAQNITGWRATNLATSAADLKLGYRSVDALFAPLAQFGASVRGITSRGLADQQIRALAASLDELALALRAKQTAITTNWSAVSAAERAVQSRRVMYGEAASILSTQAAAIRLNLPLIERIKPRPTRESLGYGGKKLVTMQQAYDELLALALDLEAAGFRTSWDGRVKYGGAGRNAATFSWTNFVSINPAVFKYSEANRLKVYTHELIHGTSNLSGKNSGTYGSMRGWEEGVVEGLAQVIRPTGYNTYAKFVGPLDTFAEMIGMDRATFYSTLIRVPLDERPAWALDQAKALKGAAGLNAQAYYRTLDKELRRRR